MGSEHVKEPLKPCPFCGLVPTIYDDGAPESVLMITMCDRTCPMFDEIRPIDIWNRRADDSLRREADDLRAEVREWLCVKCNWVYPGPPAKGFSCVICPKCCGDCGPKAFMLLRSLRREVEKVRNDLRLAANEAASAPNNNPDLAAEFSTFADRLDRALRGHEAQE